MAGFTTAVEYGVNIKHVLMNNSELGRISKERRAGGRDVWQTSLLNPNLARCAEHYGALGLRVTERSDRVAALTRGVDHDGLAFIEVVTGATLI